MLISIQYFIILVFFLLCLTLAVILLTVSYIFSPKKIDSEKIQAYECGFDPFSSKRIFFDMHFYMIAILFIIFSCKNNSKTELKNSTKDTLTTSENFENSTNNEGEKIYLVSIWV